MKYLDRLKNLDRVGLAAVVLAAFVWAGCANRLDLEPAASADAVAGLSDAAVTTVDGVRVVAQADQWPGDVAVTREVTPVRVVMENSSSVPVRLRYEDFALIGPNGAQYAALPPYRVEGEVSEPRTVDYSPVTQPGFAYSGFSVAPYYADVYPTLSPYAGSFYYDPYYYDTYGTYWASVELPTEGMLQRALPEGVIEPGGRVEGYIYFERVGGDQNRVNFTADLTSASDSDALGRVSIPFTIEES